MSTATSTVHTNQASRNVSGPPLPAVDTSDMTPHAQKIVYLVLLAGILFLGSIASYVWYGFYQWKNIP
jgi:hypothetical protein